MGKFKVVLAGCGSMANEWVKYALSREDVEFAALVDIKKEFADAMAGRYGLTCPTYTDLTAAIEETGADLVFDVTIPASHFTVCTTSLLLGCSVFSEKPMAATMAEAREMIRVVERSGKSFSVMQNRRYDPNIRAFRDLIQSGTIGRPGYVGADFFYRCSFWRVSRCYGQSSGAGYGYTYV